VAPIALVVAIQASGISEPVLEKIRKIGGMIQPLITGESAVLVLWPFQTVLRGFRNARIAKRRWRKLLSGFVPAPRKTPACLMLFPKPSNACGNVPIHAGFCC
jgi:hypothetical protein